jgi:hypothetical protein
MNWIKRGTGALMLAMVSACSSVPDDNKDRGQSADNPRELLDRKCGHHQDTFSRDLCERTDFAPKQK